MKVLLLLPYAWDTSPGQRYRIEQWVPDLERLGVEFQVETLLSKDEQKTLFWSKSTFRKALLLLKVILRRQGQLIKLNDVDCIWIYRAAWPIGPAWPEKRLARKGIPIIYDFDDAIWLADTSEVNRRWAWMKFASKTGEICKLAKHVVVGNQILAEYAHQFNQVVTIVPSTVNLDIYELGSNPESESENASDTCVIGWTGSHTTSAYLKVIEPAIRDVAKRHKIRFRVIGAPQYECDGVDLELVQWRSESEVEDLRPIDIGIMPMPDNPWSRGKCGMKAIQYMAMAIPTIVSPIGFNKELIQHNQNGLLAETAEDWVNCLERLIVDKKLRKQLGAEGRNTVEKSFCATVQAQRVFDVIAHTCKTHS
jgi:glycosyltransferase involved in cell wall biosynthesis